MNIFALVLATIATQRGPRRSSALLALNGCGIHPQQIHRLWQSTRNPRLYHLLSPKDLRQVECALDVTPEEAHRLDTALLATAIGKLLSGRLPWANVCSATDILFELLLHVSFSNVMPATFPKGNIFAWVLQEILAVRGYRITQLDNRPCLLEPTAIRRLFDSLSPTRASRAVPVLSPEDLDSVIYAYNLRPAEVGQLYTALLATAIYRLLVTRTDPSAALQRTNALFPMLLQALQEDIQKRGPLSIALQIPDSLTSLNTPVEPPTSRALIQHWLRNLKKFPYAQDAKKFPYAQATVDSYGGLLTSFSEFLHLRGYHLLSDPGVIARFAREWASTPCSPMNQVALSPATIDLRLTILTRFYRFIAQRYDVRFLASPISVRESLPASRRAPAFPPNLDADAASQVLAWLDRSASTGEDSRNYALLWIALTSARPPRDLLAMTIGNLQHSQDVRNQLLLTWGRARPGGTPVSMLLSQSVSEHLLRYIFDAYLEPFNALSPDRPLWVSYSNHNRGECISSQTLNDIAVACLGTSSIRAYLAANTSVSISFEHYVQTTS